MSADDRSVAVLFVCGLLLLIVSFWNSGIKGGPQVLTNEKAKEMQEARREYHRLSHETAHRREQLQAEQVGNQVYESVEDKELQEAERTFNRLKDEIDAIRNGRLWLTGLLRYGGFSLVIAGGVLLWYRRRPASPAEGESKVM
jgi:hypothetical protein